jgi:glycosyltransferase involved in cell wall biosynthesis
MDEGSLRHDIRRLGLADRVRFVDATSVPDRYFSIFDFFALTSREDPFPLVCLEASLWEVPIVSFDSGGARELIVDGDIGRVVPYGDLDAMADAIVELAGDERLRSDLGRAAKEKVGRFDVSQVAPRILATIDPSQAVSVPEVDAGRRDGRARRGATPLVAVCVPTYNGARYLEDALASIAAQTVDDYEVVLVDDGSTDATLSVAERFRSQGLPLSIHRNGINQGPALNWNRCLELSEGRWVKFVFQDDLLAPTCLERMLDVAEGTSNGFVACERGVIYEDDIRPERRNGYEEHTRRSLLSGALRGRAELTAIEFATEALTDLDANFVGEPVAVMFDRRLVHRMGGFNPDLIQSVDFEYWLRIGSNVGMSYVPEALSTFRVHGRSTTVDNEKTRLFRMTIIDKLLVRAIVLRDPRFAAVRAAASQRGIDLDATLRAEVAKARQFLATLEGPAAAQSRRDWEWALAAYPVLAGRRRHRVLGRRAART